MLKSAIASVLVLGSVSFAAAMPAAPTTTAGASLPIVKAAVIVRRTVIRHPLRPRRVVHTTTVIRR